MLDGKSVLEAAKYPIIAMVCLIILVPLGAPYLSRIPAIGQFVVERLSALEDFIIYPLLLAYAGYRSARYLKGDVAHASVSGAFVALVGSVVIILSSITGSIYSMMRLISAAAFS